MTARVHMLEIPGAAKTVWNSTLGEITGEIAAALWKLEDIQSDEELSEEAREAALDAVFARLAEGRDLLPAKLENCLAYLKSVEGEIECLKSERERINARIRMRESRVDRFKGYMLWALNHIPSKTLTTLIGDKLSIRKSVATEIYDDGLAWRATAKRAGWWRMQKPKPAAAEFKKALQAGEEIPGARLVEHENLSVR